MAAYEIRVFPDHCVNRPRAEQMNTLRRMPGDLNISIHDCFADSSSIFMVDWIWAISARTKMESRSPSAWYFTRISKASSLLSLLMRYLGLSGKKL